MAKSSSSSSAATGSAPVTRRRSERNLAKKEVENEKQTATKTETDVVVKEEPVTPRAKRSSKRAPESATPDGKRKRVKTEDNDDDAPPSTPIKPETDSPRKPASAAKTKTPADKAADLQAKKLKSYAQFANGKSPFPDFAHPTPAECKLAYNILASLHGEKRRPKRAPTAAPTRTAGCGNSPSVLDALVRTILSQNTSNKNSSRAKLNMDAVYGGSDRWDAIVAGGQPKLQETIASGGLSVVKSKVIISILRQVKAKYGVYSLDHLFGASDEDAMTEMLAFQGVGPKTASCVLLFCLQRENFAVDTHVHRITGLLGWRPKGCTREETYAHLDARIPDEDKYGLHVLIISHGRSCDECRAGGKALGKCELRKAFRSAKVEGEAGDEVKNEEIAQIKLEEEDVQTEAEAVKRATEQFS